MDGMLKTLQIHDDSGHGMVQFVAGSDTKEEQDARRMFKEVRALGRFVYRETGPGGQGELVKTFDALGPQNMILSQLQAG